MTIELLLFLTGLVAVLLVFTMRPRFLSKEAYIAEMVEMLEEARSRGDHRRARKISHAIEQTRAT